MTNRFWDNAEYITIDNSEKGKGSSDSGFFRPSQAD